MTSLFVFDHVTADCSNNDLNNMLRVAAAICRARGVWLQFVRYQSTIAGMEGSQQGPKLQVNVDITSDVMCPWCWVGKRHLDTAVERLSSEFDFHIRWKPFLLNAHTPEQGEPVEEHLRNKYGEGAAQRFLTGQSPLVQAGRAVGLTFNPNRLILPTKKAHILLEYAAKKGKQHELHEVMFRAYFSEARNVNSEEVLRELVLEVGLDPEEALGRLKESEATEEYEKGIREAMRKAITGVPHFEISLTDNPHIRHQFSGAQPIDTFISVFNRLRMLSKV